MSLEVLRCHDYERLTRRWKQIAKGAGLQLTQFGVADGYPLWVVKSPTLQKSGGFYLSAGVHGDEPAGAEGLATWAEANLLLLRELPFLIFPCINPWGLVNNTRTNASGLDLNRIFHQPRKAAQISAWKRVVAGHTFAFCHHMHEDYDAQGCYIYEIRTAKDPWGSKMLRAAETASGIPPDPRPRIEGRKATNGIIWRRIKPGDFPWVPEALFLHFHGFSRRIFTFETPSELAITDRISAQIAAIDRLLELVQLPVPPS